MTILDPSVSEIFVDQIAFQPFRFNIISGQLNSKTSHIPCGEITHLVSIRQVNPVGLRRQSTEITNGNSSTQPQDLSFHFRINLLVLIQLILTGK